MYTYLLRAISQTLTVTVLRPVVMGSKVKVEKKVVGAGRKMANVRGFNEVITAIFLDF
jgi:predicted transcriptional regulator